MIRREHVCGAAMLLLLPAQMRGAQGQDAAAAGSTTPAASSATSGATSGQASAPSAPTTAAPAAGGVIRGRVLAGTTPLPGVAVTAANSLTGKGYTTTTDVTGSFAMRVPANGRYVVRTELAAFAGQTTEVLINADGENGGKPEQVVELGMQLASRVAAEQQQATARQEAAQSATISRALGNSGVLQSLSLQASGSANIADATAGGGNQGAQLPSLAGLGDAASGAESVAITGQAGQTNGLANLSEDEIRERVQDALAQARRNGGSQGDLAGAVMGVLGGFMGPGGGGFGGGRGGFGGGHGGGGGGRGGFRNFDPTKPHGNIFYQGGNGALDATSYSLTGAPVVKPDFSNNRFGVSFAGSPFLPGLIKASTKQFVFFNVTGQRNITPENLYATVPSLAERTGDFSALTQTVNGVATPTPIYDPTTGMPFANNVIPMGRLSPQALAVLNFYPAPNLATGTQRFNYQTITTAGNNAAQASLRYVRNLGAAGGTGGFGGFGGGGRGGGGGGSSAALHQNINVGASYAHGASDLRNVFLPLGGASVSDGYNVSLGYTIGRGHLNNNATLTWNRSHAMTRNYFTNTGDNPAAAAGIVLPSQGALGAASDFYNGLPNLSVTNFTSINLTVPLDSVTQTISYSDFVSWSHRKHNVRAGGDLRRVHADSLGGNNPLGTFSFSGYATESAEARTALASGSTPQAASGAGFADFLLGLPQQTTIQAGLNKTYLRANVYDAYVNDDFRVMRSLTLNGGLRYEYFSPYVEKNNRLVNLDHNADFTAVVPVLPDATGPYTGVFPRSLVNPDRVLFSPRLGFAWRPSFLKQSVLRGGYGINYNTGQFATFAQALAYQPPFAVTQTNVVESGTNVTGCTTATPTAPANLTLANGFGCSTVATTNNYSVNKNYRLGRVQVYSLDLQRTLPMGIVLNIGYNGSYGGNLDIVRAPNHNASMVTSPEAQAFRYEDSVAYSRFNALAINARKRLQKGVSLQATYTYGHSIDNASSIGGSTTTIVQDDQRLDLEESNSSFDQRQRLTGNWVLELPFGPNRAYLSSGGKLSKIFDGFSLSGDFTFATGLYFTPQYNSSAAELAGGGLFTLRPDRVFTNQISGGGTALSWFNKSAFTPPVNGYGTASRNSIRGPGTVAVDASLSRTISLGDTRSFEARVTGNNVFNTVQYSGIDTSLNSATFGQVTSTAAQRTLLFTARYRF